MKTIITLFLVLVTIACKAQIGMSAFSSFTPSYTTHGSSVTLKTYVKNKSNTVYAGTITVFARVDTLGGIFIGNDSLIGAVITAGDSLVTTITFTPQPGPGGFNKVNCCVNPIIVWPIVTNGTTLDTLRCGLKLYSTNTGINKLKEAQFLVFPNPVKNLLTITPANNDKPKSIIIYDVFGQIVKETEYQQTINVSYLSHGCYWLSIINSDGNTHKQLLIKE